MDQVFLWWCSPENWAESNTPVSTRAFLYSSLKEQRQLKVASKSFMPRNASVALEAGSWIEIPICVILSDCFLLCLWAFILKYRRKMTVSLALAEKSLELQLIHRGKLRTDSELGYCSFSLCTATCCLFCPIKDPPGDPLWLLYIQLWMKCETSSFFPKEYSNQARNLRKIGENTYFNFASNQKAYIIKYAYISRNSR